MLYILICKMNENDDIEKILRTELIKSNKTPKLKIDKDYIHLHKLEFGDIVFFRLIKIIKQKKK